ncbi:hypothetical protein A5784_14830 [Mycobacterium sp. 852013-50091_SCH5140682]|uniref:hypothetical protein n=1 Tax=Mycobacterium sp. 852013-50091_SCH5140682 TaxID=1834109 RepID=UPI0007E938E2|nr:hypothetical protein [Mycobacterium sp. 852013-50091_SCH5140682]OBC03479.1 hypothetical protein A5784_14830 [Mycobacterium sp. 852013-50091_SCH5140682]
MEDKRRARMAKQVRRDARRAKKRDVQNATLSDFVRRALVRGHPVYLLDLASRVFRVVQQDAGRLNNILTHLIGDRNRETTALLAVLAELLDDEPAAQLRCREELAGRDEHVPQWIPALSQVDVYRAVRRSDVLGDADVIVLGARIDGEDELTVVVWIDHTTLSGIADAGVVPKPIDKFLTRVAERSIDTDVVEMSLADARAWIENALAKPTFAPETERWPLYRALVQWLARRLPEGGEHRWQATDWPEIEELCDRFFATDPAAPFTDSSHRELLLELLDEDRDPLRWSMMRVEQAVGTAHHYDYERIPLEVALDAPDLLRAFIPFAHAQSGIRDELTSRVLAVIDALRSSYKREVLKEAEYWGYLDAG